MTNIHGNLYCVYAQLQAIKEFLIIIFYLMTMYTRPHAGP
jgi:hypothetical protein